MTKGAGHNSIAADQLRNLVERVENINEEIEGLQDDRKCIMAEAKATGFDPKMIRYVVKERAKEKAVREEERALMDAYLAALGLL